MKQLTLTNSPLVVIVDDEDYEACSKYLWYLTAKGFVYSSYLIEGKKLLLSRFILNAIKDDGMDVDHINRDRLDNRRINLRLCTICQNQYNKKKRTSSTSKYKGVHFRKDINKWRACASFEKRVFQLGHFSSEKDAAIAVNNFYAKHDPEFRIFNIIEDL